MTVSDRTSSRIVVVEQVAWRDVEPGVRVKPLWSDRATGRWLMMGRVDAGVRLCHRHVGDELVFVMEGASSDEWGTTTPGSVCYRPPGCAHTEWTDGGVTNLSLVTGGGIEPAQAVPGGPRSRVLAVHELPWEDPLPGLRVKRIWEHPDEQRRVALMRFEPGVPFPLHRHEGDELVFVLEGSLSDEDGVVSAGNVAYRPSGCVHRVVAENGATVLGFATGRVEFL